MANKNIKVKTNEENPEPVEIIAQSIIEIATAMKKINSSRLKQKALIVLINAHCKVGKTEIEIILNCISDLEKIYIKN